MTCSICHQDIEAHRLAYRKVVGWERPGRGVNAKSGSSIVLRNATDELAHPECIVRLQNGVNANQETLV